MSQTVSEMQQEATRRREIYRYSTRDTLFSTAWSNKIYPDKKFRIASCTFLESPNFQTNKINIIELSDTGHEFILKATLNHGYPASALKFYPNSDPIQMELLASTSNCLKIFRFHPQNCKITQECELVSTKSNFSSPLTNLDWNEIQTHLVGVSSIDTTCTIWNIEVEKVVGSVSAQSVKGSVNKQLIAHEKPVHDIAFTRFGSGCDQFATAGFDGSIRLFDLRQLQHSTILYEDSEKRPLNRLTWNRQDHTKLATVPDESNKVIILDIRMPCRNFAILGNHRSHVNGIAWAPHSAQHICSAGSDKQALIWEMNHSNNEEPILAYNADSEISQVHWAANFNQWICITFHNNIEILRV